jgi:DNA mismatch endonuclease (patch repair protein)
MVDVFSTETRSRVMAAVRSTGNRSTEETLRRLLMLNSLWGWRRHRLIKLKAAVSATGASKAPISVKPDFVFRRERLAIFVDGCFWHGCPQHFRLPATNQKFWSDKIKRNIKRDRQVKRMLIGEGWNVLRIWEHEFNKPKIVVRKVSRAVERARIAAELQSNNKLLMDKIRLSTRRQTRQ